MARKTLSILLALCMVLSLMPFGAFAAENDTVTYELTDQLVEGVEYLIVSANDGEAVALTNDGGSKGTTPVTIVDGKIELDDSSAVWTSAKSGDYLNLGNNGSWLYLASGGFSFRTSMSSNRGFTYSNNQLQVMNYYKLFYDASSNQFTSNNSTSEKVYLFAKEGSIAPPAQLEPGTYMIVISGHALTANRSAEKQENAGGWGYTASTYTGLDAVAYTEGMAFSSSMVWTVSAVEGGFAISNNGNRLVGTYVSGSSLNQGDLNVGEAEDVWTLSSGKLVSANAGKQLAYESAQNMFTVRSSGGDVTLVPVDPADACQHEEFDVVGEKAATCTEDGYTGDVVCSNCGEVLESGEVVAALGHNWGEWTVVTPAGDTTPGEETRTCSRCGEVETRELEPLNAPTYEQADRLVDGVEYLIVSTNQDGTAYVLTNPGASAGGAMGSKEVTIENGKIKLVAPEALWTATAHGERFDLTNEGAYLEGKSGDVKAFSTQQYPNRAWAYTDGHLEHLGGTYTYEVYHNGSSFTFAQYQGAGASHTVYLFALEGAVLPCQHDEVNVIGEKAATCTEDGYTGDIVCASCGVELEKGEVVPALGHNWSEWTVTVPVGEYTPGEETRACSRCGETEVREIEPLHIPTYEQVDRLVDGVEYLIVSTNQDGTAYVVTNPGATEAGASMGKTEVTIANGKITGYHDGTLWTATSEDGQMKLINDGGYLEGGSNAIKIYTAPKYTDRGWTYTDSFLQYVGGTYTYELYYTGTSFTHRSFNTGSAMNSVYLFALEGAVQPCQHENLTEHAAKEANCTEAGNDAYWECNDCHKLFSDAAAQTEIDEPVVYEALGHVWGEWETVTAPGATTRGSEKRVCSRCGEEETRATDPTGVLEPGTYVIVIGGNAVTTVRSANSAQGGTTEYKYTGLDGVPYVDGETEATAEMIFTVEAVEGGYVIHSGDSYLSGTYAGTTGDLAISDQSDVWVIDGTMLKSTNATTSSGSGKYLGYVVSKDLFTMRSNRTDSDLKLDVVFYPVEAFVCDHASTEVRDAVEATCTEAGYTGDTYCTVCGEKLADGEAIPALGHSWDEGVVTTRPTGAAEGVKTFTCLRCGETRTESIPKLVNPFVDVAAGKFYFEPVLWAFYSDPQVTSGVTDTTFMPDRICTRAHVVTFLWRANGCPEPQSLTSEFKDVKDTSKYYYKAVLWAAEQGITTGYKDGTFRPDAECTRGQVVTFLWRANGSPDPTSTTNPFADVANGQYYTTAVLWAVEQGITQGRTPTTFGPNDSCTRGHVVTFLYRAYAD